MPPQPNDAGASPESRSGVSLSRAEQGSDSSAMREVRRSVVIGVAVVLFAWFACYSVVRLIDADEGYLLLAARLVGEGEIPYRDFFFPQGPLLPLVYGAFSQVGSGWYAARLLTAVFATVTALSTVVSVARRGGSTRAQLLAAFLMGAGALSFAWLTIAKTYALSAMLLVAAHAAAAAPVRREKTRSFGVGLLIGLTASVRPYAIAAAPFILHDCRRSGGRLSVAIAGLAAGALPGIALYWVAPNDVVFGLVEYHLHRSPFTPAQAWEQKLEVLRMLFGLRVPERALGLQVDMMLAMVAAGIWFRRSLATSPALFSVAALSAISIALTPTHVQYFVLTFPFLAELAALAFDAIETRFGRAEKTSLVLAAAFAALGGFEAWRHAVSGRYVPGVMSPERARAWSLAAVGRVATALRSLGSRPVLTEWPGYLVGTDARPLRGVENHFAIPAADRIEDPSRRFSLHLVARQDVVREVETKRIPIIVVGNATEWTLGDLPERAGYVLRASVEGAVIWEAEPPIPRGIEPL